MTNLAQFLVSTPRRFLWAIGRVRHISLPKDAPKATLVERLAQALANPDQLAELLTDLAPDQQAVLSDLCAAGGRLPCRHLVRRYGELRPYRPWRSDAPPRPWENPASPLERLWYLGLIFLEPGTDDLVIPDELLPVLDESVGRRIGQPVQVAEGTPPAFTHHTIDLLRK